MKEKYILWLIITSLFNHVIGQQSNILDFTEPPPIPDKCRMYNDMFKQCCVFPPFFVRNVAQDCGARIIITEINDPDKPIVMRRHYIYKDHFWECVLTAYDLFESESSGYVDLKKYFAHLDRWVNLNKPFADAMKKAKTHCKIVFQRELPLRTSEFFAFQKCLRQFVRVHCPTQAVIPTADCEDQKKFYDECNMYYI